eukprot:2529370-Rhodomonas_salina.2
MIDEIKCQCAESNALASTSQSPHEGASEKAAMAETVGRQAVLSVAQSFISTELVNGNGITVSVKVEGAWSQ